MKAVFNILLAVVLFAQNLGPIYAGRNSSANMPGQENIIQSFDDLNQIIETPAPEETQFPTSTAEPAPTNAPEESATPTLEETPFPEDTPTPLPSAEPTALPTEMEAFKPQEPAQSLDCPRDIIIETPRLESELLDSADAAEMLDAELAQIEPQPDAEVIVCPSGANISAREGKLKISFPENKTQKMLRVKIGRPAAEAAEYFLSDEAVEISAYSLDEGKAVRQFSKELSIEFTYDPEAYAGVEEALSIFYYDEAQRTWITMPTRVDKKNHTLRARSNHLTVFDYDIEGDLKVQLPNLDQNTLSQYTGAATYSIPINVPSGPGGLTPNLSLQYSSQVIDELPIRMQGAWVGMGWNLNTPSLERNRRGTYTLTDDSWTLNFYGSAQTIFLGEDGYYHALDENFQRGYFSGGNFYLRDKDGSLYTFASKLTETQLAESSCDRETFPWRYLLTKITDRFGNSLTFAYTTYSKNRRLECDQYYTVSIHTGATLSSITYDQSVYKINFLTETRTDYDTNWETSLANSAKFSKARLNEIQVVYNNTQIIKRYQFFYSGSPTDPTPGVDEDIYPEYQWSKGGKTLTLIGLQEIGRDGGALPRYSFAYADNMHLSKVENGYGGSVEYTYAPVPWYDTGTTAGRTAKEIFSGIDCDNPENAIITNWYREGTAARSCYNGWLRVSNGWAYRGVTNTGTLVKPGGMYKAVVNYQTGGMDIQLSLRGLALDGTSRYADGPLEHPLQKGQMVAYLQLGADIKNVLYKRLYCSPSCAITRYELYQLPTHYQVETRTITAAPADTGSTFTYSYDDMASNDEAHSWQAGLTSPAIKAYEEYRGNAIARELAPGGGVTSAYFYQDDYRQGREYLRLSGQEQYYEPFEDATTVSSAWSATPVLERSGGDPALKLEANGASRATSLSPGQAIVFQFKPEWTEGAFQGQFTLTGENSAIGLTAQQNGWFAGGSALAMPPLTSGEWYTMLIVIGESEVAVKVWNRSAPDGSANQAPETPTSTQPYSACPPAQPEAENAFYQASFPVSMTGAVTFAASSSAGILWLDGYQELRLYRAQETPHIVTYKLPTNRPPNAAGLFFGFTRAVEQRSYAFEGTAAWIGTRATLSYDCSADYTGEYGNLTWTEEYAAAYAEQTDLEALAWQPQKGVETRYQPNVTSPTYNPVKYLAAFPAQVDTYACETEPCEKSAADLLARSVFLYDNATSPQTAPTQGCLTGQRVLLNPGKYADTQYACDGYGNVVSEKRYPGDGEESNLFVGAPLQTLWSYDAQTHARLTSETLVFTRNGQDASLVTQIDYDAALGLPVAETDANGNVTTASYDQFGRILSLRKPGDEQGDPSLAVSYALATDGSQATGLTMSASQRVAQNPDGSYLSYEVAKTYNGLGQLTRQRVVGAVVGASPQTITVEYAYDALGRLTRQSMPYAPGASPAYTQTGYDALGRPLSLTATDGTVTSLAYGIADGQLVTTTTAPNQAQTQSYADAWGRVTRVEAAEGPGVSYTYDAADRLVGARYGTAPWTTLSYDLAGRKTGMVDPDMGLWTYAYNALGSLTVQTDAAGCTTEMSYDGLGRLAGKSFDSACPATAEVTYVYDGVQYLSRTQTTQLAGQKGYRSGMLDGTGYTNWTYDARGRVVSEQKTIGTRAFASDWTYNSADLAASMVYPADENNQREVVSYHYLPQKLLYSLTGDAAYVEASQYDEAGRLTRRALGARDATQAPLAVQYQYAGWGPDANANDDYYDGQGRLMSITSGTENAPGALLDLSYRYDIGGNITQITDANLGPQVQSFGYDALDRIVSAQAVGGSVGTYSESYSYDSEGRLVGKNGVTYTYNPEESPFHAVGSLSDGKSYEYDANGSMTTRVIGVDTFTLLYDGSLRMVAVQKNGATIAEFAYDGDGRMVVSNIDGVTTYTVGGYFEWRVDASGSRAVKYYSAGSARVAMRQGDAVTYLFGDHLGSTSVAFNDVTNAAQSQGYTAFGEERYSLGGDLPTDYKYTGQKEFAEIGLHFYNARWYDSALGRFTQADSIIPQPGNPMAWDRYAYVLNSPINQKDPSGHAPCYDNSQECQNYWKAYDEYAKGIYQKSPTPTAHPIRINAPRKSPTFPYLPLHISTPIPPQPTATQYFFQYIAKGDVQNFAPWGFQVTEGGALFFSFDISYSASITLTDLGNGDWSISVYEEFNIQDIAIASMQENSFVTTILIINYNDNSSQRIPLGNLQGNGNHTIIMTTQLNNAVFDNCEIQILASITNSYMGRPGSKGFQYKFDAQFWNRTLN